MINVQTLINEAVEESNQYRSGLRDNTKFSVSDAGTCYRKRYFKRLGVEPTTQIATGSLRKMAAGDAGHDKLQNLLKSQGKLLAAEDTIETEHVKGHFDAIVEDGEAKVVLEIKTIEKWAMGYVKKDGPKPEHLLQMFTYWSFLRSTYSSLDQAILFYVKREDFEGVPFNFLWSDDIKRKVANEWVPLIDMWKTQTLPECTCHEDYGGKGLQYCRYPTINDNGDRIECCSESLLKQEVLV